LALLVAVPLVPASFLFQVGMLKRLMPGKTPDAGDEE
jgi:hypothetical protein